MIEKNIYLILGVRRGVEHDLDLGIMSRSICGRGISGDIFVCVRGSWFEGLISTRGIRFECLVSGVI